LNIEREKGARKLFTKEEEKEKEGKIFSCFVRGNKGGMFSPPVKKKGRRKTGRSRHLEWRREKKGPASQCTAKRKNRCWIDGGGGK